MKLLGFYNGEAVIIDADEKVVKEWPRTIVTKDMFDWYARQTSNEKEEKN